MKPSNEPGPATYYPNYSKLKTSSPKICFKRGFTCEQSHSDNPGPGAYTNTSTRRILKGGTIGK